MTIYRCGRDGVSLKVRGGGVRSGGVRGGGGRRGTTLSYARGNGGSGGCSGYGHLVCFTLLRSMKGISKRQSGQLR